MKKILLAGATGYLGGYIVKELKKNDYYTRLITRDSAKLKKLGIQCNELVEAEVTNQASLENCCEGIDVVISTIGITRQKDNLTYMDVDYQANANLLNEAKRSNVKKFIFVSVLKGNELENIKVCQAKEKFVKELSNSGLDYCIIRPNGFFLDMIEFYKMAQKGKVYLFGDGTRKINPIHGEDLAKVCVHAIEMHEKEIKVGGPEIFTHNDIANIAFEVCRKKTKIVYIPEWMRKMILILVQKFTKTQVYGPMEFFLTVMGTDMVAPKSGNLTLKKYFEISTKVAPRGNNKK